MEVDKSDDLWKVLTGEEKLWLEEISSSNGIEYSEKANYSYVGSLELFSLGITLIPPMRQFPGLAHLCLVGHQIKRIKHLESLACLKELWLCDCSIQAIENLDKNRALKKLYLYENQIKTIENIDHLTDLEVLWLNGNEITKIEGMTKLENLKEVNLSENLIVQIGTALASNRKLESLNLSGNLILSVKDATNLACLPNLRSLSLKDPLYPPCPVALLCNYTIHLLFHLPYLVCLDSQDVSSKTLKDMAETTVAKKIMFYKMKLKTAERGYNEVVKKLEAAKEKLNVFSLNMSRKLLFSIKQIQQELEELNVPSKAMSFAVCEAKEKHSDFPESDKTSIPEDEASMSDSETKTYDAESSSDDELEELLERVTVRKDKLNMKLTALAERVAFWEKRSNSLEHSYKEMCRQARNLVDQRIQLSKIELETVGNVKFEDGTPSDSWYGAVHDLFMSRFSDLDYRDLPVTSVKIHRITRIFNRSLHMLFDNRLENLTNKDELALTKREDNRVIDYLFHTWDNANLENKRAIFDTIENGFDCGSNGSVRLANSLGVADKSRIKYVFKKNKESNEKREFRYGLLLVCKTYLGKSCKITKSDRKINKSSFPSYDSAYQTRRHAICPTKARNASSLGITELCDCNLRRCTWHVFDSQLILPEYLIEFEYATRNAEPLVEVLSSILLEDGKFLASKHWLETSTAADEKAAQTDNNTMNMDPNVKTRPRMTVLTEDLLLKHTGASYINRITVLNFNGSGLSKLKLLSTLTKLKKLIVSFNDLTTLQDLSGMSNLEYLDASFNKITSVDGFKGCTHLTHLDLSWNRLHYTREEVGLIRKYLPAIKTLHLNHNNFLKPETLRLRCIGRLRNLSEMDNQAVTEEETALAIRMAASSRIAYVTILAHSRTDGEKPRTLHLDVASTIFMNTSKNKPVKLYEDDKKWFFKVTCLQLDNQHLSKISNLDNLENLRFVSFNNNDLTKIEGLEHCPQIEELSLKGNCISKLEGINHLIKLETLILDDNNLVTMDATNFERLVSLKHLSLENNLLTRLKSLQKAASISDLFLGNNKISNNREIFHLKNISSLSILDLAGNPMANESPDQRLFILYHIQSLRALDGITVDPMEEGLARDVYGGRLTQDFVAERLGHSNFVEVCELDLPNQGIRNIDLGSGEPFGYLTSVNLEHNNLTNFGGLIHLNNLKVLCLNFNHIESITGKTKGSQHVTSPCHPSIGHDDIGLSAPLLDKLEVLHLGFNGISNLSALHLGRLRNIKTLFLQGNEISKLEGLDGLRELRELVLDKNKIKAFSEFSFVNQWKLTELHCEENRLRELSNIEHLINLQRLFIGLNRIQESAEMEKLESLSNLIELSVIGNPVTRRLMHRPMLVFRHPNLRSIDGIQVTNEERTKAELYFLEQQGGVHLLQTLAGAANISLPGINASSTKPTGQVPLKVTQVQLSGNNPEFSYQLGQRIQTLDQLQNLSPPPLSNSDYQDNTKSQKNNRKNQTKDSNKSGGHRDVVNYDGNRSISKR